MDVNVCREHSGVEVSLKNIDKRTDRMEKKMDWIIGLIITYMVGFSTIIIGVIA